MNPQSQQQPLPSEHYDAIVIGTSLPESLLSAALSLSSASVLHLDPNPFYGSSSSTLPVSTIDEILHEDPSQNQPSIPPLVHTKIATILKTTNYTTTPLHPPPPKTTLLPLASPILIPQRQNAPFNPSRTTIDLAHRPVMAAGPLLNLLARTNVAHYVDFRSLAAIYLYEARHVTHRVPATRADVFNSADISVIDKRRLTRFVKQCLPSDDSHLPSSPPIHGTPPQTPEDVQTVDGNGDVEEDLRSLTQVMDAHRLSPLLKAFLRHAIAMTARSGGGGEIGYEEGVSAIRRFYEGVRAFGTATPFLYPNYGCAEVAQAFCRMAAVHGATHVLRRAVVAVAVGGEGEEGERCVAVVTECGDVVTARHVFVSRCLLPLRQAAIDEDGGGCLVWRFVGVVDGSVTAEGEPDRVMVVVPRGALEGVDVDVRVRQVDAATGVCESGTFIVYAEGTEGGGQRSDILRVVKEFVCFGDDDGDGSVDDDCDLESVGKEGVNGLKESCMAAKRPRLLWGLTYGKGEGVVQDIGVQGVEVVAAPEVEIDADGAVEEAERCFRMVFGEEKEFLPQWDSGGVNGANSNVTASEDEHGINEDGGGDANGKGDGGNGTGDDA